MPLTNQSRPVSNWGNYPQIDATIHSFETEPELLAQWSQFESIIPRGAGLCYGDQALAPNILSTKQFNKFIAFDANTGHLTAQSGVRLRDILDTFVPRGWFLPITPGTKLISIGGAIGSNVHGKSHHKTGSFENCVDSLRILLPNGEIKRCSRTENAELFSLTCGGNGLTGVVLTATIQLMKIETAYMREKQFKAANLDEVMDAFEATTDWTYSVAWIDCLAQKEKLGRSILMLGEHAKLSELKPKQMEAPLTVKQLKADVPFMFPNIALNPLTMRAFNFAYYHKNIRKEMEGITDYNTFFYPLDGVTNWNRIYGKRGFTQYQFVLPKEAGREGLREILAYIAKCGMGSFLAVLKLFGEENTFMSFPHAGYTLALDFPIQKGLFPFLDELDRRVANYGGRLYPTKDVRMEAPMMESGYPNAPLFKEAIEMLQQDGVKLASLQSARYHLTP